MATNLLKRALDIFSASFSLLVLSPLLFAICILIRLSMRSPIFFRQQRPGLNSKPFVLLKFRTMTEDRDEHGNLLPDDKRLTRLGRFLRRTSLDELPELFNILNGNMSIVGPRPEVEKYIDEYYHDFRRILKIRPGLSDLASIKYRSEEEILAAQSNPEKYYVETILIDKLNLAKVYVENITFKSDVSIILETMKSVLSI